MAHVHYNKEFGALMKEALGDLSLRVAAERCSLSHTTLAGMVNGKVPRPDTLAQVADGLIVSEDLRARLYHEAGYVPKRTAAPPTMTERDEIAEAVVRKLLELQRLPSGEESGADVLFRGLRELEQRRGEPLTISFLMAPETLTPDQARDMLTALAEAFGLQAP